MRLTMVILLVLIGCSGAVQTSVPTAPSTPTTVPTAVQSESLVLPREIESSMLSHDQLVQWADWFAWELTLPPDGPLVRMEYDFKSTLASCGCSFTRDQASEVTAENTHFSRLPYSHKYVWKSSTQGLQDVNFWETLYDPNISDSDRATVQEIVGDFMWRYQLSVTKLISHYSSIDCEDTVDLLQELLYPHYDSLPFS